ncbi:MAG: Uncharacterized protein G01um101493_256 [Microgenomates group bacterium Gr01-1014_93]|nr:MAG: Uncharacterized protein G01um101493_256 [Microgenomates group bacterium Gr01-1014_93]
MKTLILLIFLAGFLQTTILPLDLVLLILLLRSYIKPSSQNLILAFGFGLLISLLSNINLGIYSLIYLSLVELTNLYTRLPVHKNLLFAGIALSFLIFMEKLILMLVTGSKFFVWPLVFEILSLIPLYFLLLFWEERFVIKHEIKLKF